MYIPALPSTPTAAGPGPRALLWACALMLTGLAGAAQATTTTLAADTFANGSIVGTVGGLTFGTTGTNWYAFSTVGSPMTFQIGTPLPQSGTGAYTFLNSGVTQDFRLNSLTIAIAPRNDTSRGWFDFYNNGVLVATGDSHAKATSTLEVSTALTFNLSIASAPTQTLSFASVSGYYDRVALNYGTGKALANEVGIRAFSLTTQDPNSTLGQVAPSPVPEPSTYAMMLAGIAAVGFMSRRRKVGGEG